MWVQGTLGRLVERRAGLVSDPAKRLRFLQRAMIFSGSLKAARHVVKPGRTLGFMLVAAGLAWKYGTSRQPAVVRLPPSAAAVPKAKAHPLTRVWPVDVNPQFDLYSNGLRVEKQFLTSGEPRSYWVFPRTRIQAGAAEHRTEPAGIVFHTTESQMPPFQEDQTHRLKRAGENLLDYVRRNRSYHFVIDRYGRVFRIVPERDGAHHAGHSVWADQAWVWVNLNQSFFGVAFEAQGQAAEVPPLNPAQVHAGRILTQMLRARYGIAAANCVAHAQVSVNPAGFRAGYHTDWAANLPFGDLGLGDNYERPLPSLTVFGFSYDPLPAEFGGPSLLRGLRAAEAEVRQEAAARGLPLANYRKTLQRQFRTASSALRARGGIEETN